VRGTGVAPLARFTREVTVRKTFVLVIVACLISATGVMWAARQTQPPAASKAQPSVDDVMQAFRTDLQSARADVIAKNMTFTAEQAAKFWPMFNQYQKEQNVIMDDQLREVQKYVDSYQTLDDPGALALINAHLDNDTKMTALRRQWLAEFQTVLGAKQAARLIQIDRRLSLVSQVEISSRIPLLR
jgi:Spy/CpxP family protein refolding chaperone